MLLTLRGLLCGWLFCLTVFGASQAAYAQGGITYATAQLVQPGMQQTAGLTNGRGAYRADAIHARWFRFIAPQSGLLTIGSCGQAVDTRLHLYRGSYGNLIPFAQSDDACDTDQNPATPNAYAAQVDGRFVLANDTIFIEWDDHWDNNGFTWTLSFQEQEADGQLLPAQRLVKIPPANYPNGYPLRVLAANRGQAPLQDVTLTVAVTNQMEQLIFTDTVQINALSAGVPWEISLGNFSLVEQQNYHITYVLSASDDRFRENDTLRQSLSPTEGTFSIATQNEGTLSGLTRGNSWFGQVVRFDQDELLRGLSFSRSGGQSGDSLMLHIYAYDGTTINLPDTILGPWLLDTPQPKRQFLDFGPNGLSLSGAPTWLFAIEHRGQEQRLFVDYQQARVGQGEAWTKLGANNWESPRSEGLDIDFSFQWHTMVPRTAFTLQLALPDSLASNTPHVQIYRAGQGIEAYPMVQQDNGQWRYDISLPASDTLYYRFQQMDTETESIPVACSQPMGEGSSWRWAVSDFSAHVTLPEVCYGQCTACDEAPRCTDPLAVICDPFDAYSLTTEVSQQATWWNAVRPGEDAVITAEKAYSPPQSLLIQEGGRKQTRLQLPDDNVGGIYQIQFRLWVPTGFSAGMALLPEVGIDPLFNFLWGTDESGRTHISGTGYTLPNQLSFTYTPDQWEAVTFLIDPNRARVRVFINGQLIDEARLNTLPAYLQLYSPNPTTRYFVDDVQIAVLSACPKTALLCESFEWYTSGARPSSQSVQWQFTQAEGIVDTTQSASGHQALLLEQAQYIQAQLSLGGWNKGRFALEWQQFVPTGRSLGMQLRNAEGTSWFQLLHNRNGERSGEAVLGLFEQVYNYPTSEWFTYRMVVDMNVRTIDLYLNGQPIIEGFRFREKKLDNLYFFMPNAAGKGWIDAITFSRLPALLTDVAFGVDLNRLPPAQRSQAFIQGSFTNWEAVAMESTNDGRFRYQALLPAGDTVAFRYLSGPDQLESSETLTECGISDPEYGTNRLLIVGANSMNLGFPCFSFCSPCSNVTSTAVARSISSGVSIFPNPARNTVQVRWPGEFIGFIRLVNSNGATVQSHFFAQASDRVTIPLQNYAPGLYYVQIIGRHHKQSKKLIVY